jgi:hypothetical protein
MRPRMSGDQPLGRQLAVAIGIDWRGDGVFHKWPAVDRPGLTIDCRRRGKDDPFDAVRPHRRQDAGDAVEIDVPEQGRLLNRAPDLDQSGEMDHGADPVIANAGAHRAGVAHVADHQRSPSYGGAVTVRQVVEHHRLISGSRQRLAGVRADITRPAGDQYPLRHDCLARCPSGISKAAEARPLLQVRFPTQHRHARPCGEPSLCGRVHERPVTRTQ